MLALSASGLLAAWEQGVGQVPVRQALALLPLAGAETSTELLEQMSLGRRDGHLLSLHERLFGPRLDGTVNCPRCDEPLEVRLQTDDLHLTPSFSPEAHLTLRTEGYEVTFRLPNSSDLAAIAAHTDRNSARLQLLDRIVLSAQCAGRPVSTGELPPPVVSALNDRLMEADPQADLQVDLTCPQCAHRWLATLDIVSFLWEEVGAWAARLLRETHELARAYGWSEADILALSAVRRQAYLELIRG